MELVEHRLRLIGVDDLHIRLQLKQMGFFKLMTLPEATIVTVVEIAMTNQKNGQLLHHTLEKIEKQRKLSGQNQDLFQRILGQAIGANPAQALVSYCLYRIKMENNDAAQYFDIELTSNLLSIAYNEISAW